MLLVSVGLGGVTGRAHPVAHRLVAQQEEEGAVSGTGWMEMGLGGHSARGTAGTEQEVWAGRGTLQGSGGAVGVRWDSEAAGSAGTPLRVGGDGDKEGRGLGARWQQWGSSVVWGASPRLPPHPAVTSVP